MKKIAILCFDYAFSSVITGVLDLFSLAGVTWNRIQKEPPQPLFDIKLVSRDGLPVRCLNNLIIEPDMALTAAVTSDILFIPPIGGNIEKTLSKELLTLKWLREMHQNGCQIVSSCTGSFMLAETGLLDGKLATTHWGYIDQFKERYPAIQLKPEQLITNELSLLCAGGGSAWLDLSLLLIEQHFGHDIAVQTAKALVIERKQQIQTPYFTSHGQKYHSDTEILAVQTWLDAHFSEHINIDELGARYGFNSRTFKRRFKLATGDTPLAYIQSLRVEMAKKLLESSRQSIEQITQEIGYIDSSSFMKLFKKKTGLSPQTYRQTFSHVGQKTA
ncbi:MAG: helix-turn-helix domain-containing protein [Sedimenticola sp.]|nr:helix-turn-helix domain-containing protein [Sedimenticola sp.]